MLPIGVPIGTTSATVTLSLYDAVSGTGTLLGSGNGSTPITSNTTPFNVPLDISPVVSSATFSLLFPTGLPRISFAHNQTGGSAGTATMTFDGPDSVSIPTTSNSTFLAPITLSVSDPTVTISPTNLTSPSQVVTVSYSGSAAIGASVTFTAKVGGTTIGTLVSKTSGFQISHALGLAPNAFSKQPNEITVGTDGFLWFAEGHNTALGRMDPANPAAFTEVSLPIPGNSPMPVAIAAGVPGDPHVWFTQPTDSSGNPGLFGNAPVPSGATTTFATSANSGPYGIRALGNNVCCIWVAAQNAAKLYISNTSGVQVIAPIALPVAPLGLAVGPDGNMWVAGFLGDKLLAFAPNAPFTLQGTTNLTGGSQPAELTIGPDNALWFTERGTSKIGRITAVGQPVTEFALPAPYFAPTYIVAGSDGGIWITAADASFGDVLRFDPTAHTWVAYQMTTTPGPPPGMVAGPDGNLWASDFNASAIVQIQP
jgi:virginiamycin B lyase